MAARIRYALERTTPDGIVKTWPGTMTPREAAQTIAYCLADNGAATRRQAAEVADGVATQQLGEVRELVAYGYTFRLRPVTEGRTR